MSVTPPGMSSIMGFGSSANARPTMIPDRGDFASELQIAGRAGDEETLREAATQLVASTFLMPVLAMLREGSTATGPFAPGIAEKRFGPMMDLHIADNVAKAANFPIVDAIVNRFLKPSTTTSLPSTTMLKEPLDA